MLRFGHKDIMRRNISIETRKRVLKTYVFSIVSSGSEAWTLNNNFCSRINAFETWCYRRMFKTRWDKVNNVTILNRVGKEKQDLLDSIKERKLKYAGLDCYEGFQWSIIKNNIRWYH
uniref:Uncharacterized protein n=1 Tax=Cacopsylla melanoneura TaxID=428564 RepID=A0A8D9E864_9HEMI